VRIAFWVTVLLVAFGLGYLLVLGLLQR
jgi:hypothetical protein